MNKALHRLSEITNISECMIVGLMSGTSLDGLDIALCRVSDKKITQEKFKTINYPKIITEKLRQTRSKEVVSLGDISYLHTKMALFFAEEVLTALKEWGVKSEDVHFIASHGQTIFHDPENLVTNTFQIVDGDHIAQKTGILTISDFRQKHVSIGGEGAPLAKYLDEFLFQDERRIRIALNLGGIANLTVIFPVSASKKTLSTDVGPANTLINDAMIAYFDKPFDDGGQTASEGNSHSGLVKYLLLDPFFRKSFPKSTGQELFNLNWVKGLMESHSIELSPRDLVATLTELTIKSIVRSIDDLIEEMEFDLILSGGGFHNKTILAGLERDLPRAKFLSIEDFGISGDAKEAVLIAFLGYKLLQEKGFNIEGNEVHLGKISLPN